MSEAFLHRLSQQLPLIAGLVAFRSLPFVGYVQLSDSGAFLARFTATGVYVVANVVLWACGRSTQDLLLPWIAFGGVTAGCCVRRYL